LSRATASLGLLLLLPVHVGAALVRLMQPADAIGRVKDARTAPIALRAAPPPPPLRPEPVREERPSSGLASL
jgi:hypothetical protein